MRQNTTFVRLRGNRGTGMADARPTALDWAWYKTVQSTPIRSVSAAIAFPRLSDPGSVFGLLPPGAEVARATNND